MMKITENRNVKRWHNCREKHCVLNCLDRSVKEEEEDDDDDEEEEEEEEQNKNKANIKKQTNKQKN